MTHRVFFLGILGVLTCVEKHTSGIMFTNSSFIRIESHFLFVIKQLTQHRKKSYFEDSQTHTSKAYEPPHLKHAAPVARRVIIIHPDVPHTYQQITT